MIVRMQVGITFTSEPLKSKQTAFNSVSRKLITSKFFHAEGHTLHPERILFYGLRAGY